MRARDLLPLAIVLPLAGFVAAQGLGGRTRAAAAPDAAASGSAAPRVGAGDETERAVSPPPSAREEADRVAARRRLVEASASRSYLPLVLQAPEGMLTRWPTERQVTVWVAPSSRLAGWHPRMVAAAREAFDTWRGIAPVEFRFVADSQAARVVVTWLDRFSESGRRVGHARRFFDQDGWIVSAEVALAVHDTEGRPLTPELIRAAALHEVGHVLGLPHSDATTDIMYPSHVGSITRLSLRDEATGQALYAIEPGVVR